MKMKQTVTQIDIAEYSVKIALPNGETITRTFERSNKVYPAYKTLVEVLRNYDGVAITVETNSDALYDEFNAVRQNPNAALLNELKEVVARRAIVLTVEYVAE